MACAAQRRPCNLCSVPQHRAELLLEQSCREPTWDPTAPHLCVLGQAVLLDTLFTPLYRFTPLYLMPLFLGTREQMWGRCGAERFSHSRSAALQWCWGCAQTRWVWVSSQPHLLWERSNTEAWHVCAALKHPMC